MTDDAVFVGSPPTRPAKGRKLNAYFKSEARRTLYAADNYYKSVLSHLICGMFCGGFLYLTFYVPDLVNTVFKATLSEEARELLSSSVNTVLILLFAFFLFAFFSGVCCLAAKLRDDPDRAEGAPDAADLSEILKPLGSRASFGRTAALFIILAAQLAAVTVSAAYVVRHAGGIGIGTPAAALVKIVSVAAASFMSLFFVFLFIPMPYVLRDRPGIGAFGAYRESARAALRGIGKCFKLLLSFIPLLILSVLSFGVLFFAYVLPYYVLSAAKLGEYLYYTANIERNVTDEQA